GAFGTKGHMLREEAAVCAAASELGRSVKWIEDRNEHLLCGGQAREESIDIEAAVTRNGVIRGLKVSIVLDQGAYPAFPVGATLFARLIRTMFPGPYRIPTMRFHNRIVASNKGTYVAYRGPWAMETFTRERLLDVIARELAITRAEVRLRNMIGPDELPNRMITGPELDIRMSAKATLERALELCEFEHWEKRQAEARASGRCVGLGVASYIEAAPGPPGYMSHAVPGFAEMVGREPAVTVLEEDGSITLYTQQVPHGQGQETTMAQVAADELGVRPEQITLKFGDSRTAPFGLIGTGGSRSAAMYGAANALSARAMREQIVLVAASLLEADPSDIEIDGTEARVRGVPSSVCTLREIAAEAIRLSVGKQLDTPPVGTEAIRVTGSFDGGEGGWAQATHVCWVEIDLDTGMVTIPRYLVVEDCGEIINPAIVDGQIRGGVAQGVGAVLYERSVYDDEGQMVSGTFMDYLIPTVSEIPEIEIEHLRTPSDIPFNYRGVGEGGMIGAPAAITNAIEDALTDRGARIREQHLPPSRILELAGVIEPIQKGDT
ncbi:MAG: aerobic carbon-monoxide dehydrogenase large subunit, partial [Actinomycetota bacterium]|nr:aerobic carbon-monoxide dehydrogenase large subunit [Actinomycetota bacterium]